MTIYILNLIRRHQTPRPGRVFANANTERQTGRLCPRGLSPKVTGGLTDYAPPAQVPHMAHEPNMQNYASPRNLAVRNSIFHNGDILPLQEPHKASDTDGYKAHPRPQTIHLCSPILPMHSLARPRADRMIYAWEARPCLISQVPCSEYLPTWSQKAAAGRRSDLCLYCPHRHLQEYDMPSQLFLHHDGGSSISIFRHRRTGLPY